MTKEALIKRINDIVEYITNGSVEYDRIYNGHPAFYILHTKEEFDKELQSVIENKEIYDRYDLYYYTNYMFKYMLNQYDSHTQMFFTDSEYLPIKIRFIYDENTEKHIPYIVDGAESLIKYKGSKILKINDIDIKEVINQLEKIICYACYDYLKIILEYQLINSNILNSLPIMKKSNFIKITTDKGDITFNIENLEIYKDKTKKKNYTLEVVDKTAIITYRSCRDENLMKELVNKLSDMKDIENYIVDIRGNGGGNSSINTHLVNFLNGKNVVVLCDERVFSSARMCMIDFKNNGAKIIGTNSATPISCFGNCVMQLEYKEENLRVMGSATYWYYDKDLKCYGIYRGEFEDALKRNPDLLDPVYVDVDELVELTLEDYINNNDSVLNNALDYFNKQKSI